MPKYKKGNTYGFKHNCVPYYKVVKREKIKKKLTCPYIRLAVELDEIVQEAPTPSERQVMLLWPDSYHLLRRGCKEKVPMNAQTAHIYRSQL